MAAPTTQARVATPAVHDLDDLDAADVVVFWGDGCPYSAAAIDWLERYDAAHPDVTVVRVEVWEDAAGEAAFAEALAALDREPRTVPTFLVDGQVRVGFDDRVAAWVAETAEAGEAGDAPVPEDGGFTPLDADEGRAAVDLGDEGPAERRGPTVPVVAAAVALAVAAVAAALAVRPRSPRR